MEHISLCDDNIKLVDQNINNIKLNLEHVLDDSNEELAWKKMHAISRLQRGGHCNNLWTVIYY
jgi:hypothetical protein